MRDRDVEVTYALQYQHPGDPAWYELENPLWEHPAGGALHSETGDLAEAVAIAGLVRDGMPYPIKPHRTPVTNVTAVRVVQRVHIGGVLMTFGEPVPEH